MVLTSIEGRRRRLEDCVSGGLFFGQHVRPGCRNRRPRHLLPGKHIGKVTAVKPIIRGLSGAGVYAVSTTRGELVLRVDADRGDASRWTQQLRVLRRAAERGVAPAIVYVDESARAIVSKRVAGVPLPAALADPAERAACYAEMRAGSLDLQDPRGRGALALAFLQLGAAAIGAAIDAFNAVNREESLAAGANWVDITPISRDVPSDPTLLPATGYIRREANMPSGLALPCPLLAPHWERPPERVKRRRYRRWL